MIKRWIFICFGAVVSVVAATMIVRPLHQPRAVTTQALQIPDKPSVAVRPLDELMPEGALLYVEARNFSKLLEDWNNSSEKAGWLASDTHSVFSQSRLFLRLDRFFRRFGVAAGMPADTQFATVVAGEESALALYDIGKIQFVYTTHLHSQAFLTSALWQSRNKFPTRVAAGVTYFLGTDPESKHVVAFAVAGDYLVLATREDLMVKTLQLLELQPERSLHQASWYSAATATAPKSPGDLRMVLDMKRIAVEPHFRSYWLPQNITEMEGYTAAVSDLYCEGKIYREERVLLRRNASEGDTAERSNSFKAVNDLLRIVPADYGFYQARQADSADALEVLDAALISPTQANHGTGNQAPQVVLTSGEVGSQSDLETRIDVQATRETQFNPEMSPLKKPVDLAQPVAFLEIRKTDAQVDGALLAIPSLIVISANRPWDAKAVQQGITSRLSTELSISRLGLQWRESDKAGGYLELDGLHSVYLAIRGHLLYISDEPEMLVAGLHAASAPHPIEGLDYIAGFNHARERENFYEISRVLDTGSASPQSTQGFPHFFSSNIGDLSLALSPLLSEEVVQRNEGGKVFQTVTYRWSR